MHRFSTSLLGLGALGLAACGAPAELDESLFPSPNDTGYDDGSIGTPGGGGGSGLGGSPPLGGNGNAPNVNNGGSSNVSQGGTAPLGMGGAQNGGNAGSAGGGGSNAGSGGGVSGGPGGSGNSGGCPDDITELFRRPGAQGGCEGGGCHTAGGTPPDSVSPNVEQRLVNVMAVGSCSGRPYVGGDNGVLADKLTGNPPACGAAMPFLTPQALNAADEQCILDWIEEISGN